jgi:hypothetical protein
MKEKIKFSGALPRQGMRAESVGVFLDEGMAYLYCGVSGFDGGVNGTP